MMLTPMPNKNRDLLLCLNCFRESMQGLGSGQLRLQCQFLNSDPQPLAGIQLPELWFPQVSSRVGNNYLKELLKKKKKAVGSSKQQALTTLPRKHCCLDRPNSGGWGQGCELTERFPCSVLWGTSAPGMASLPPSRMNVFMVISCLLFQEIFSFSFVRDLQELVPYEKAHHPSSRQ